MAQSAQCKIAVLAIILCTFGVKLSVAQSQCDTPCATCRRSVLYVDQTSKNDDDVIKFYCVKGRS